jgi:hypothetical protein
MALTKALIKQHRIAAYRPAGLFFSETAISPSSPGTAPALHEEVPLEAAGPAGLCLQHEW